MPGRLGSPEVVEYDFRGNLMPAGLTALQRLARQEGEDAQVRQERGRTDAARNERLRDFELRSGPTRIDYGGGPAAGPFGDRPEFYTPETMDPIAASETARQDAQRNFDVNEPMKALADTAARRRVAEGEDYGAELAAKRYWDPATASMRENEFGHKYQLATDPAQIAAGSRENVASTTGQSRVGAATVTAGGRTAQEAIRSFDDWVKSGAFGFDAKGMPNPAPPDVANFMNQFLGRAAGAPQALSPDIEAEIQRGTQFGYSREEIIQHLRSIGRIR